MGPGQARQPILQLGEAGRKLGQHLRQRRQRLEPLGRARKQFHAQPVLGPPQMLADRAHGHAQFLGSRRQRPAARHDLDGPQGIEGNGKRIAHIDFL
ncbi:hypothetical protein D9M68_970140 [compost metagenome]